MAAGPYPTKDMFENLKARVATVETSASSGGAPPKYVLHSSIYEAGTPTPLTALALAWERRSLLVAGVELAGGVNNIEGIYLENNDALIGKATVADGTLRIERRQGFTYLWLVSPVLCTDATLSVIFTEPTSYGIVENASLPVGVRMLAIGSEAPMPGAYFGVLGMTPPGVPIVPVPSDGLYYDGGGRDAQRVSEIVWPERGAPYLHVMLPQTNGSDPIHYHLPLSAGLPQ